MTSFDPGTGQIWLDDVTCTGTEKELMNCTANSTGNNTCIHAQDAGVKCSKGILSPYVAI